MRFQVCALAIVAALACLVAPAAPPPDGRPATVKVAAVQCSSELGAVEANRTKFTALIEEAAAAGAKIIVIPETSITGYLAQDIQTNWRLPGKPMDRAFKRSLNPLD